MRLRASRVPEYDGTDTHHGASLRGSQHAEASGPAFARVVVVTCRRLVRQGNVSRADKCRLTGAEWNR